MEKNTNNLIVELTFDFSLKVIEFVDMLEKDHKYTIAKQLLRSGTSIGANVQEAQSAESRADFIHKLKIAAKETNETHYWLSLCKKSKIYNYDCEDLINCCNSIIRVLAKIIISSRQNSKS